MASIRKHVTREVVSLDSASPIRDAARLMADRQIGSVGVKEDGKLVGLVTERDLVVSVLARAGNANAPIREAMRGGIPRVKADATEVETLREALADLRAEYAGDRDAAKKLISIGETKADEKLDAVELAAWTMLANTVLNLDEVLNKG